MARLDALLLIAYYLALGILAIYSVHRLYLVRLRRTHDGPRPPLAEPQTWPSVTVQLPLFNEPNVAARLIDAVAAIDYAGPFDIQVLDDSNDVTTTIVAGRVTFWRGKGVAIAHHRRGTRDGYKAGALAYGLARSDSRLFAVFDADFVPPPDILTKMVPHFELTDDRAGRSALDAAGGSEMHAAGHAGARRHREDTLSHRERVAAERASPCAESSAGRQRSGGVRGQGFHGASGDGRSTAMLRWFNIVRGNRRRRPLTPALSRWLRRSRFTVIRIARSSADPLPRGEGGAGSRHLCLLRSSATRAVFRAEGRRDARMASAVEAVPAEKNGNAPHPAPAARPPVGMVQARWTHLNREHSLLTRVQAIYLDAHFTVESAARNFGGRFFNFNGTAGIWRREAIDDAGGWSASTLTEDLDLSYRAQLAGWRFVFLPDVEVLAELPEALNGFQEQQHRWAKGSIQTARKLLPRILGGTQPARVKAEAFFHLTNNSAYLLTLVLALLIVPAIVVRQRLGILWTMSIDVVLFFASTGSVLRFYIEGQRRAGRTRPTARELLAVIPIGIGISIRNSAAVIEGLFERGGHFRRTPKSGDRGRAVPEGRPRLPIAELVLASFFVTAFTAFAGARQWIALPFLMLFTGGFLYVAAAGLIERFTFQTRM